MTDEQRDLLGYVADKADNLIHASMLPMTAQFHVEQLRAGLEDIRNQLRGLYVDIVGDNPWNDE